MNITARNFEEIEKINGTLNSRYEYLEAIAEIFGVRTSGVRHGLTRKITKGIMIDENTEIDIECKTVKGKMMIKKMNTSENHKNYHFYTNRKDGWYEEILNYEWNPETRSFGKSTFVKI